MAPFSSITRKVTESDLLPGDHIYCYRRRSAFSYAHHGIYIGNDKVIHFLDNSATASEDGEPEATTSSLPIGIPKFGSTPNRSRGPRRCNECVSSRKGGVQKVCLTCFLKGDTLQLFYYGVSKGEFVLNIRGGCSGMKSEDSESVLRRANFLLETNGFGKYNLQNHNCEDFAIYCKTGVIDTKSGKSKQVEVVRQFGKSILRRQVMKFDAINMLKSMKDTMVNERWDRDASRGMYLSVEELVRMYRPSLDGQIVRCGGGNLPIPS